MKNLTFTLCLALLCSVGFAQAPTRKAPEKNNMVKEKASSEEKIKPTSSKYPTKPSPNNQDVNKRAAAPSNTMVKEKPSSSVEVKNKYPTSPGVSNAENRGAATDKNFTPNAPTSSEGDKLQDKTSKSSPGKTDKKYTPNAPSSTTGNAAPESRASDAAPNTSVSSFCRGWKDGYVKGWVETKEESTKPQEIPACPEKAPFGCEDYKCGYSTGMQSGKTDARKR
ncbi:MAG: hypothetical protein P8L23_06345 [Flavobacteriales bacterium]|nr:hypothetical protein [Flavobacteriales bacterium]